MTNALLPVLDNPSMQLMGAAVFGVALLHTFSTSFFNRLAHRYPRHGGMWHLLGEVEVVFGVWAMVLLLAMALLGGGGQAIAYAESRQYTEPLFVFVVMVVAASKPVLAVVQGAMARLAHGIARAVAVPVPVVLAWLGLAVVPLLGSLITEPAAMTLAALMLAPQVFHAGVPEGRKYAALGVLFVNVSIGGTLTAYAAPPVLMVASTWGWDSAFMASTFGWKAALAVVVNATAVVWWMRGHLGVAAHAAKPSAKAQVPLAVSVVHLLFLAAIVLLAHHPVLFMGVFVFFLGYTQAYARHQSPLLLKEGLLVGFFLAGLVVLGGLQKWWLQPVISGLEPLALFFGAVALTAVTDNAALTYLGSLIEGISAASQYMLVAGAVAGGGLTVIANAPNPAGVALLKGGFGGASIGAGRLFLAALPPTAVAAASFLCL